MNDYVIIIIFICYNFIIIVGFIFDGLLYWIVWFVIIVIFIYIVFVFSCNIILFIISYASNLIE
jgi:hypothetical protein